MRNWTWKLGGAILLAAALAACGGDKDKTTATPPPATETVAATTGAVTGSDNTLGAGGIALNAGASGAAENASTLGSELPGCDDPSSTECPTPLTMDLDGQASSGGATISYPSRYFDAATADSGSLITITPSERNKFDERATFEVYFADSVEAALAGQTEAQSAPWTLGDLQGTISVTKDATQDPLVSTATGAFALPDGRAIVLKVTTTGDYGWTLWSQVYEAMLNTLTVSS